MKITKQYLKQLIKEELDRTNEGDDVKVSGTNPNEVIIKYRGQEIPVNLKPGMSPTWGTPEIIDNLVAGGLDPKSLDALGRTLVGIAQNMLGKNK